MARPPPQTRQRSTGLDRLVSPSPFHRSRNSAGAPSLSAYGASPHSSRTPSPASTRHPPRASSRSNSLRHRPDGNSTFNRRQNTSSAQRASTTLNTPPLTQ